MPNHVKHFAIHADNVERARQFYEAAFGWAFRPWGPPNFYLVQTGPDEDRGLQGALQQRTEPLTGAGLRGYECTIGVDNLQAAIARITEAGGKTLSQPYTIDSVGELVFIEDTEANRVGIMQYDPAYEA